MVVLDRPGAFAPPPCNPGSTEFLAAFQEACDESESLADTLLAALDNPALVDAALHSSENSSFAAMLTRALARAGFNHESTIAIISRFLGPQT
jgi:ATP phosphoribosyltransferase regulatory subunit HisZ